MPFCPNPDCRDRELTGKPAEFRSEVRRCAECGSKLVPDDPTVPRERIAWPAPLKRRLLFTLGAVALVWLSFLVSPWNIDALALEAWQRGAGRSAASIAGPFALGILPFFSAFALTELAALVLPRLRHRRREDPGLRRKLVRASLIGGALVAMLQGYSMAVWLEGLFLESGGSVVVPNPGWGFRLSTMLTMTTGSCLLAGLAQAIGRRGVGSGFAVLILADWARGLPESAERAFHYVGVDLVSPAQLLLGFAALGGMAAGIVWFLRLGDRREAGLGDLPIHLPTCGTWPIELAVILLVMPSTVNLFFNTGPWLPEFIACLAPDTPLYLLIQLGMITGFVPLASRWFYWRRRKELAQGANRAAWIRAQVYSGAFLVAVEVAWYGFYQLLPGLGWLLPATLVVLPAAAMLLDLWQEIRARRRAPGGADLVPLAVHQDVADALVAKRAQPSERGAFLQGLHFRSLTYFFGPFVPLVILGTPPAEGIAPARRSA